MRKYEIIFIVRPDVPDEDVDKFVQQMEGVVGSAGGKIENVDKWGRRRLAYHIGRHREGFYVLFVLEGTGETVREFERRLKVADTVIKFLTVRTDEQIKRAEKFKVIRAKQSAKKHRQRPAGPGGPASPSAQQPAAAEAEPAGT
jgi:small subunit ribosomal protein S6